MFLPEIIQILHDFAQKSMDKEYENIHDHSVVTLDGSWNHRRTAKLFILDLICEQTYKTVGSKVLFQMIGKIEGNYNGPSYLMESEAFKRMIPKLMM